MNKPITMLRQEYLEAVVKLTNDSPLPAFIKADVMTICLQELKKLTDEELRRDTQEYKEKIADATKDGEGT